MSKYLEPKYIYFCFSTNEHGELMVEWRAVVKTNIDSNLCREICVARKATEAEAKEFMELYARGVDALKYDAGMLGL